MEQTKRALLAMHALTERRREAGGGGDEAALSPAEVAAHGERLLREWSELAPLSTTEDAGGPSALHHLDRIGLLEWRAGPDRQDGAETAGEFGVWRRCARADGASWRGGEARQPLPSLLGAGLLAPAGGGGRVTEKVAVAPLELGHRELRRGSN